MATPHGDKNPTFGHDIGKKFCDLLGIKGNVKSLDIRIAVNEVVMVTVTREFADRGLIDAVAEELAECQPVIVEKIVDKRLTHCARCNHEFAEPKSPIHSTLGFLCVPCGVLSCDGAVELIRRRDLGEFTPNEVRRALQHVR